MSTKTENESDRIRAQLAATALRVANSAQIILSLDPAGNISAEMPGINGAVRRKVDLPGNFLKQNPQLSAILQEEVARLSALRRVQQANAKVEYIDPSSERARRNAEISAERAEQFAKWLDSLPVDQRENEIRKRDARLAKAQEAELARARDIYTYTATHYPDGIALANRIIDDPKRRPARKLTISISADGSRKEISPRTGTASVNGGKKFDPRLAIEL